MSRVGTIDLGLDIDSRSFNRQLRNIGSSAESSVLSAFKGLGGFIGKALGVTTLVAFGKQCIDLGSDLSEVQNVVDVTFGSMAEDINKFASEAITNFGISETSAKRYTSTMGAMLKSMGLGTQQAVKMSQVMAGLSADMASFYNLDADEAFEKIRSGISGETEPLKQLGINMSVANMEAYAMSQGIEKSYQKMTQQEQALLRYNYLLKVTADAQGDFSRTSNSWANQTRILAEQFNALKAEIGQGLIAAFTPVIQGLNFIISKLRVAAGYFKAFMELIFGKQSDSGGGISDTVQSLYDTAGAADGASSGLDGIGDSAEGAGKKAKKAAKDAAKAIMGFDELNILSKSESGSGGGSGASGGGAGSGLDNPGGAVEVDLGKIEDGATVLDGLFSDLIDEMSRLKDLFMQGFSMGIGDDFKDKLKDIQESLRGIKESLIDIFTDSLVVEAAKNLVDSWVLNLGKIVGSMVSIGATIAQNLLGGIDKYLEQNKGFIKERLIGIMDASAEIANLAGDFAVAFADIFSVFGGDTAQQITADLISIFSNAFLAVTQLALMFGADVLKCMTQPIIDNKDLIKTAIEETLIAVQSVTGTFSQWVTDSATHMLEVYETYIGPAMDNIATGLSNLMNTALNLYNTYMAPMLQEWGREFNELYTTHIQPAMFKIQDVIGKGFNLISQLWKNLLEPLVSWLLSGLFPALCSGLDMIWNAAKGTIGWIMDVIKDMWSILEGLIDFVTGVFTGDWSLAWEGVKEVVNGIGQYIYDMTVTPLMEIISWLVSSFINSWKAAVEGIKNMWSPIGEWFNTTIIEPIKQFFSGLWEGIKNAGSQAVEGVKTAWSIISGWFSSTVITPVQTAFTTWGTAIKTTATNASNGLKSAWQSISSWFNSTVITPIKNAFSTAWNNIKSLATSCVSGIKSVFQSMKSAIDSIVNSIRNVFSNLWSTIANGCRSAINGVLSKVESGINSMASKVNSVTSKVGINIPSVNIPKLARGGILDQPTIAMVGEAGKEAVVPLENNTEWVAKVASLLLPYLAGNGGGNNSSDNRDLVIMLDGTELARAFLPNLKREADRQGVAFNG